tara:strand:+ start:498 stop:791 length:294 start_codon:yes stop_codon:yes gene_type:complete
MPIFHSKKDKRAFWVYFFSSLIVFTISAVLQELKYRHISRPEGDEVYRGLGLAILAIMTPLTYLIIVGIFINFSKGAWFVAYSLTFEGYIGINIFHN